MRVGLVLGIPDQVAGLCQNDETVSRSFQDLGIRVRGCAELCLGGSGGEGLSKLGEVDEIEGRRKDDVALAPLL
jgi:hypothetical protein